MKIIQELEAIQFHGDVEVVKNKLFNRSRAEVIARTGRGTPLLCVYDGISKAGRRIKQFLPLTQILGDNQ